MQNKRIITQHIKLISVLLIGLFLSGCFWSKPKPVITTTEHINTCVTPPKAGSIVMRTPTWYAVKDKDGILWVAITPQDYTKMSVNTSEILTHIKQKNAVIKYYKKCNENDKNPK